MKSKSKIFYLLTMILSIFSCEKDDSDSCPTNFSYDVVVKSQKELENFCKCKYKVIERVLTLSGGVNDLSPLRDLEQVGRI